MQVKVSFLLVPLHEISAMDITCKIILGDYMINVAHTYVLFLDVLIF